MDSASLIAPTTAAYKKQPLHRQLSATKLRPILRGFGADSAPRRGYSSPLPSAEWGMGGPVDQRKPLPPPPRPDAAAAMASGQYFGGGAGLMNMNMNMGGMPNRPLSPPVSPIYDDRYGEGGNEYPKSFSFASFRQSLPQLPFGLGNRGPRHQNYVDRQTPRYSRPLSPYSSESTDRKHHSGFMNASMPNINDVMQTPSPRSLMEPADNLNAYLRHAQIPKWDKWIDPVLQATGSADRGRWQNRNMWTSGANRRTNYFGGANGKAQTVERLVNTTMQRCLDEPGQMRRLQSWECRRNFFDAVEECRFIIPSSCCDVADDPVPTPFLSLLQQCSVYIHSTR